MTAAAFSPFLARRCSALVSTSSLACLLWGDTPQPHFSGLSRNTLLVNAGSHWLSLRSENYPRAHPVLFAVILQEMYRFARCVRKWSMRPPARAYLFGWPWTLSM